MAQSSVQNIASSNEPEDKNVVSLESTVPKNGTNHETDDSILPPADLLKEVKEWRENNVLLRNKITKNGRPERPHSDDLFKRNSASILEVKEHAHIRFAEELQKAQEDLQLKDEECKKLSHLQEQMDQDIDELTASLFERANKMVQDANIKRMNAERLQKESQSKIDVLQAEVTALKELVITSTPSMPNRHLHPQISNNNHNSTKKKDVAGVASFVKGHRRSTSHHSFNKDIKYTSFSIPQIDPPKPPVKFETRELDLECFDEFLKWKKEPDVTTSCFFLKRIVEEDVKPCMRFRITGLSEEVLQSVLKNSLTIEPVVDSPFPRKCALTDTVVICKYKIRCKDAEPWHVICQLVRNRITAVCDFYTYIRYISQGLVKSEDPDMYWEIVRLRKMMSRAKLGL